MVPTHPPRLGEQALLAHSLGLLAPPASLHQFGGVSPLMHRGQPIWPYAEWGTRRRDPICEAVARANPWPHPPPPAEHAVEWESSWPEKKVHRCGGGIGPHLNHCKFA